MVSLLLCHGVSVRLRSLTLKCRQCSYSMKSCIFDNKTSVLVNAVLFFLEGFHLQKIDVEWSLPIHQTFIDINGGYVLG